MKLLLLLLLAFLSPFADEPKPEKSDLDQIKGTWENVSRRFKGEDLEPIEARMVIDGEFMKSQPESPGATYVYELDPSTEPKQITMRVVVEPESVVLPPGVPDDANHRRQAAGTGRALHGIYKIEGDTLTISVHVYKNGKKPTKFTAEKGEGNVLDVYRRVKEKK